MRLSNAAIAGLAMLLAAAACPDSASGKAKHNKPPVPELANDLETPSYDSPFQRDKDGWTILKKVTDGPKTTQTIHVSSSKGSDSNDGLSPDKPLKTLAAARMKLRIGHPDWLVLKRGDVFEESLWLNGAMGLAPDKPIVITSYGPASDPAPVLRTGAASGLGLHPAELHKYIAVVGLVFEAHHRVPNTPDYKKTTEGFDDNAGVNATTHGEGLLIEGCEFRFFASGITVQEIDARLFKNAEIRRNVIHHIWSKGMSQGIYTYNVHGLLIEENLIDEVGYLEAAGVEGTIFNHAMYLQNQAAGLERKGRPGIKTVVRGNLIARSDGIQLRDGGLAEDNLFWRVWISLNCGGGNDSTIGGALCVLQNNVVLDGGDINASDKRGWGMWVRNTRKPSRAVGNVIAHNTRGTDPRAVYLDAERTDDHGRRQAIQHLRFEKNVIYKYGGGTLLTGDRQALKHLELVDNVFVGPSAEPVLIHADTSQVQTVTGRGNLLSHQGPADALVDLYGERLSPAAWNKRLGAKVASAGDPRFVDPDRTLEAYAKQAGFRSAEVLLTQARDMRSATAARTRAPAIVKWVKEGFTRKGG